MFNYKDSSTPADPSKAIVKGVQDVLEIKKAKSETVSYLAHGTTVGTNALIEKKGCRLGLITTKGFKDLMEIGTQRRPSLYNLQAQKPYPLVPSGLNCTVTERIRYDGSIETPLDEEETREVVRYLKAQGVAASLPGNLQAGRPNLLGNAGRGAEGSCRGNRPRLCDERRQYEAVIRCAACDRQLFLSRENQKISEERWLMPCLNCRK